MNSSYFNQVMVLGFLALGIVGYILIIIWALKRCNHSEPHPSLVLRAKPTGNEPQNKTRVPLAAGGTPVFQIPRIHRVLVPVDFSICPIQAVNYARAFALEFGASVELLHVVHLTIVGEEYGIPRAELVQELSDDARRQLEKLSSTLWDDDLPVKITLREGSPHKVIVEEARERGVDLIIMATRHPPVGAPLLRRNTLARVIREAPCPVMAVRASDGQESSAMSA